MSARPSLLKSLTPTMLWETANPTAAPAKHGLAEAFTVYHGGNIGISQDVRFVPDFVDLDFYRPVGRDRSYAIRRITAIADLFFSTRWLMTKSG